MLLRLVVLAVLILAATYFCISLYKYFKQRKTEEGQKKSWLTQSIISFICMILAGLGLYKIKKDGEKNEED